MCVPSFRHREAVQKYGQLPIGDREIGDRAPISIENVRLVIQTRGAAREPMHTSLTRRATVGGSDLSLLAIRAQAIQSPVSAIKSNL